MANLHVIGSGSSGNAYIIDTLQRSMLLECGMPWPRVLNAFDYKIERLVAVLCTHGHR